MGDLRALSSLAMAKAVISLTISLALLVVQCSSSPVWVQKKLPTTSRCQKLCPECKDPTCKCTDSCWPGSSLQDTPDKTCNCFAQLGFCKAGEKPVYTPGKECPSCWPPENKACMCFAAIGFCEPPKSLPETSRCKQLGPGCNDPKCKCPKGACWPGHSLNQTSDHNCDCFAELGFCKARGAGLHSRQKVPVVLACGEQGVHVLRGVGLLQGYASPRSIRRREHHDPQDAPGRVRRGHLGRQRRGICEQVAGGENRQLCLGGLLLALASNSK